jgi:hypothetical protein
MIMQIGGRAVPALNLLRFGSANDWLSKKFTLARRPEQNRNVVYNFIALSNSSPPNLDVGDHGDVGDPEEYAGICAEE